MNAYPVDHVGARTPERGTKCAAPPSRARSGPLSCCFATVSPILGGPAAGQPPRPEIVDGTSIELTVQPEVIIARRSAALVEGGPRARACPGLLTAVRRRRPGG